MTPERWQKLKELCHLALEREPADRNSFLEKACLGDEDLRRDAGSMIARATSGGGVLDGPIWKDLVPESALPHEDSSTTPRIPQTVGRYRILRIVGEGGMGVVYEAEQDQPRRHVALKVIRPGLASAQTLRRFDRESQALARLHHVGIAQIYEAGSAETGSGPQPYFAMEFIHGTPVREYAESHDLDTRQRLELMARICEAVQHAHENGIIHRDLKPGNILVDETGQPKILDFGVARLTDNEAQLTRQTDIGQLVGTLAYMSPEQVLADPDQLDNRSDVYALGVILYELLGKRLPYEISDKLYEAVRTIREEEPKRLSSINREFRGDVETIAAKALEKDKGRRYASAGAMLGDIRKHLADQPITARPPTTLYQLRKFAQRHKTLVGATATVFAVLLAGVVVSTWEAAKALRAEQTAQAVNDFLQNDLLAQASAANQSRPSSKLDPDIKVRTVLDRAAARIAGKFAKQPDVEAAIRDTIGQTYCDLGLYPEARGQLERALDLQRQVLGANDPRTLKTTRQLGYVVFRQGQYPQAETLLRQSTELQTRILGPEHPDTLDSMNDLANVYYSEGNNAQAEALFKQALELRRRILGSQHPDTLSSMGGLSSVYFLEGKYAQAEPLYLETIEIERRVLGPEHPETLGSLNNLASLYGSVRKYLQAEELFKQVLEIRRRVMGPEHPDTLAAMNNLAVVESALGKYGEAEQLCMKSFEIENRVQGAENPLTLRFMMNLADSYVDERKYAQAEALFEKAYEITRRVLGPEHPLTFVAMRNLAAMYQHDGRYALATTLASKALAGRQRVLGREHPLTLATEADLVWYYQLQGRFLESEPIAREVLELNRKVQPDDWECFRAEILLGANLAGQKKYAEAEPLLLEGYQGMVARKDNVTIQDREYLDRARKWLFQNYKDWGKPEKAAQWSKKSP